MRKKFLRSILSAITAVSVITANANLVANVEATSVNTDIANTPIGETCYLLYNEMVHNQKYYHSYEVVFRTETDTYLLGLFPYKTCSWNQINSVCQELENNISIDCTMVGVPSIEDIKFFYDNGTAIPVTMETWTNTSTSAIGAKAYYRNSKGSYYSTKSKSDNCGLCVLIRVSTSQIDSNLLSTSRPDYTAAKARLELEESQYNLAKSKAQGDTDAVRESESEIQSARVAYQSAALEYNKSIANFFGAAPLPIMGDANNDGVINARDATEILKYVVGTQDLSETAYSNADMNGDGKVNAKDATAILKSVVGL